MDSKGDKPAARRKGLKTTILRIGVSVVFLFVLSRFIPLADIWPRIKLVSPSLWFGVLAAFIAGHVLAAAKWRWMIGGGPTYPTALKAHFAGLAANLALPGVAGGDIVRAGMVMKGSNRKTALAVGSLADRLIDTSALLLIATGGAIWLGADAGVSSAGLIAAVIVVLTLGVLGFVFLNPVCTLARSLAPAGKARSLVDKIATALEEVAARPATLIGCAALSICIQTSFAALNAMLAAGIGAGTTLAMWMFAWPLAKLVATLPISFGGLGVREAGIAGLMAPLGVGGAGVIAASLCWQTILWATGVLGALVQIFWRRSEAAQTGILNG